MIWKNRVFLGFHILLLAEILFLAVDLGADGSYALPYPTISAVVKYVIILFTIVGMLIYTRRLQINRTSILNICFIVRIIIEIPNIIHADVVDSEIKYLLTLVASLLVVMIYSQDWHEDRKNGFIYSLIIAVLIIAIQTILTFVLTFQSMSVYWGLKSRLHLPIGSSNFVECWILMLTSFLFYRDDKRNGWRIALFLIGFVSALCTRSKVVVLIWGIWFIVITLKSYFKPKLKNIFIIAIIITTIYYAYTLLDSINFFENSTSVLLDLFSSNSTDRQSAFNGRFELYKGAYNAFTYNAKTLLIGNGRSYATVSGIAHNYFLDVLATSGIVGFILVIIQYLSVMLILFKNRKINSYSKAALVMIGFVIFNSMYEPCVDDYCFNILYWMIISFGLQQAIIEK